MKKEVVVAFSLLLIAVLSISFVVAEDDVSNETEEETQIIQDKTGAQVRVLQLQKAIYKMGLYADTIISYLDDKGEDITLLQEIRSEMSDALAQAEAITTDDIDTTVEDFVNIKEDAIELRKEFRNETRNYLSEDDKEALRELFREIDRTELQEYNEQIRDAIKEHNKNRLEALIERVGADSELAEKIRSGEVAPREALQRIKAHYRSLNDEARDSAKDRINDARKKHTEEKRKTLMRVKDARLSAKDKVQDRITDARLRAKRVKDARLDAAGITDTATDEMNDTTTDGTTDEQ